MRWTMIPLLAAMGCEPGTNTPQPTTPPTTVTTTTNPGTTTAPDPAGLAEVIRVATDPDSYVDHCSDIYAAVYDQGEAHLLSISANDGLAEEARDTEAEVTRTYTLPHEVVTVRAVWGEHVGEWYTCDDVTEFEPVFRGEIDAISGTLTVTVVPHEDANDFEPYAYATFELEDVVFELPDGTQDELDELTLEDLFVGWFPG